MSIDRNADFNSAPVPCEECFVRLGTRAQDTIPHCKAVSGTWNTLFLHFCFLGTLNSFVVDDYNV